MKKLRDLIFVFVVLGLSSTALQAQIATYNASGNLVIISPVVLDTVGLEIKSASGLLTPGPANNTFGFEFYLSNTPANVTLGNLGTVTPIAGVFVTPIVYNRTPGVPPAQDLEINYGDAVTFQSVPIPVVPPIVFLLSGGDFDFLLE